MKLSRLTALFLAVIMLAAASLACGQLGVQNQINEPAWTPPASTNVPVPPDQAGDILPTVAATEPAPPVATSTAEQEPSPAPTIDPHRVIIGENDIAKAVSEGATSGSDAQVEGLKVRFSGGKTRISADKVTYGFVSVQNLNVTGRLVARDGALQMDVDSVDPQGIVGAMVPTLINTALREYASTWYVEDVQTREGQVELRIR